MAEDSLRSIGRKLSVPELEYFKSKPESEQHKVIKRLSKEIKHQPLTQKELALLKSEILDAKEYKKAAKLFQKIFLPNPEKKLKKTIDRMQNDRARSLLSKKQLTADEMKELQTDLPLLLMQARKNERREIVQKCIESPGLVQFLAKNIENSAFKELIKAAYLPEGKVLTGKETLLFELFEKNPDLITDETVMSLVEVVIFDDMVEKSKVKGVLYDSKEPFILVPFTTQAKDKQVAEKLFDAMAGAYIKTLKVEHGSEKISGSAVKLVKDAIIFNCLTEAKNKRFTFLAFSLHRDKYSQKELKEQFDPILRRHNERVNILHTAGIRVENLGTYSDCVAGSQALLLEDMSKLDRIALQFFIEMSGTFGREQDRFLPQLDSLYQQFNGDDNEFFQYFSDNGVSVETIAAFRASNSSNQ